MQRALGQIGDPAEGAAWFRWIYHKGQVQAGHAFAADDLARLARAAAAALGLEVYGGDAIVPAAKVYVGYGSTDRAETTKVESEAIVMHPDFIERGVKAAPIIAAHLARRFTGALR